MKCLLIITRNTTVFQASGKLPIDAFTSYLIAGAKGVLDDPGQFDQCISSKPTFTEFEGKYCYAFLSTIPVTQLLPATKDPENFKSAVTKKQNIFAHDTPTDLKVGLCLPSSCSASDLQVAISRGIGRTSFQLETKPNEASILYSVATTTHEDFCHTETKILEKSSFDGVSISFL